jgi:hypothetical protein
LKLKNLLPRAAPTSLIFVNLSCLIKFSFEKPSIIV